MENASPDASSEPARIKVRPLILCGGSGTRLWPLSSESLPKQLLAFNGNETLLQATLRRACGQVYELPIIVTRESIAAGVVEQLANGDFAVDKFLVEPAPRSTAAAIAAAVFSELKEDRDPLLLAMPSDHLVSDNDGFDAAVASGIVAANEGKIVTFGVPPRRAETGYGYIEIDPNDDGTSTRRVVRFTEKPDQPTAEQYARDGRHFWNSGIFLFRASVMAAELKLHARQVANACEAAVASATGKSDFIRLDADQFLACPSISIDYAILEKSNQICMVPAEMGWSDIGSWQAVWETSAKDSDENVASGQVVLLNSRGCLIRNETDSPVAVIDATDLVIVATPSGCLVIPRVSAEKTKLVSGALSRN